jgi:hypothetical protein
MMCRVLARTLIALVLAAAGISGTASFCRAQEGHTQNVGLFLAAPDQVVAVRAGRLFDVKTAKLLSNQVVLIKGDRITDVGASVQIPAGARVIDLSSATVMPGLIDTHVHVVPRSAPEYPNSRARLRRW